MVKGWCEQTVTEQKYGGYVSIKEGILNFIHDSGAAQCTLQKITNFKTIEINF